jgi:putative endopeptidase
MKTRPLLLAAGVALLLVPAAALAGSSGIDTPNMCKTCSPCKDFYHYANGAWIDTVSIPSTYTSVGAGRELYDRNQEILHDVLDRAAAKAGKEEDYTLHLLGYFYMVLMDSTRADREGLQPLSDELSAMDAVKDRAGLVKAMERLTLLGGSWFGGVDGPFWLQSEADPKNSLQTIAQITQAGLGLPDRGYYFRDDQKSVEIRDQYRTTTAKMLQLAGEPKKVAEAHADSILKLETALAESSLTRVEQRDPLKVYHKMTVKELGALAPGIDWPSFFAAVGVPSLVKDDATIDVSMPSFMRQLSIQMERTPMDTWRAWLKWSLLRRYAGWLGDQAYATMFELQSKLTGQKEPEPVWKRATREVDLSMGEALGKAYVATEFPPESKKRMNEMVTNLRAALKQRIETRPWMSEATKQQAVVKLDKIIQKIGYPDKWRDYSQLDIDPAEAAVTNVIMGREFEQRRTLAKINKPTDRTEWYMSPPTVNAYYNPTYNEIVFPAGILQPPYFDPKADDAVNYGSIGMVIGHELTHGFDDEGRKYDADGNLRDWWTDEDAKKFEALAQKVVDQYDGYVGVDTLHLNGKLTLGENIADLGGITIAYHAWKLSLNGQPAPVIDGLTGDQRFFLGFAQVWRAKLRPEAERQRVLTDPHSVNRWRIDGPLSNMDEFREAFGCKAGDDMVRSDQIVIW